MPSNSSVSGEGERRAQRGFVSHYTAAAAIYDALVRDDLLWVGVADRGAGAADDVVLGLPGRAVGRQFKTSQFPAPFRLQTLLLGSDGLIMALVDAWRCLMASCPDPAVEIRLVTNDYASTSDIIAAGRRGYSAALIRDLELSPRNTLADWRGTKWAPFFNGISAASGVADVTRS